VGQEFELRVSYLQSLLSTTWATPPSPFCSGYFRDGVSQTIFLGWPRTEILLISASQIARITSVNLAYHGFKSLVSLQMPVSETIPEQVWTVQIPYCSFVPQAPLPGMCGKLSSSTTKLVYSKGSTYMDTGSPDLPIFQDQPRIFLFVWNLPISNCW
jgi:hypothetical protein